MAQFQPGRSALLMEKLWLTEGRATIRAIYRRAVRDPEYAALFCQHVLPRFMPLARSAPVEFRLSDPASATAILADVARAVAAGELAPEDGEKISVIAKARTEAVDVSDMLRIVKKMEAGRDWAGGDVEANSAAQSNGHDRPA